MTLEEVRDAILDRLAKRIDWERADGQSWSDADLWRSYVRALESIHVYIDADGIVARVTQNRTRFVYLASEALDVEPDDGHEWEIQDAYPGGYRLTRVGR